MYVGRRSNHARCQLGAISQHKADHLVGLRDIRLGISIPCAFAVFAFTIVSNLAN
jgi:hypothetical protein